LMMTKPINKKTRGANEISPPEMSPFGSAAAAAASNRVIWN